MRNRMRNELSRAKRGEFDLKQDPGGIADIEFLAQYWALGWAQAYPPVAMYSDTIRQLESVASADLVPQQRIDILTSHLPCVPHPTAPPRARRQGRGRGGGRIRAPSASKWSRSGTRSWAHEQPARL